MKEIATPVQQQKVLITRPQPDADIFAALCREAGLTPVLAPLMALAPRGGGLDLAGAGALAFTSANGVRVFADRVADRSRPVFAVGPASAAATRAAGFKEIFTGGGDVASLAALIIGVKSRIEGEILHFGGARLAGDLAGLLRKAGIPARREVIYEMVELGALPQAAMAALGEDDPVDTAALFSPHSAALFVSLVEKAGLAASLKRVRVVCLSEAVAEAAASLSWGELIVAETRSSEAMIAAIKAGASA